MKKNLIRTLQCSLLTLAVMNSGFFCLNLAHADTTVNGTNLSSVKCRSAESKSDLYFEVRRLGLYIPKGADPFVIAVSMNRPANVHATYTGGTDGDTGDAGFNITTSYAGGLFNGDLFHALIDDGMLSGTATSGTTQIRNIQISKLVSSPAAPAAYQLTTVASFDNDAGGSAGLKMNCTIAR